MARDSLKSVMRLIDTATKTQPVEQQFLQELKRSIELSADKNRKPGSRTYKPSGMNCIRAMWYGIVGKEPDPSGSSYTLEGICNSGTDIHVRIQNAVEDMKNNGFNCEYIDVAEFVRSRGLEEALEIKEKKGNETKLYHKELNMSFLCDGIIRYNNRYYIIEFKTESIYKWQVREGVDPKHYNQATAYSLSFGLDDVLFVYINRDLLDMKAFMFHVTDEMKQNLVGLIDECDGYVSRLICPPKPENISKKQCEYCQYKQTCRKDG